MRIQQSVKGLTPRTALTLGLKVDSDALSPSVVEAIKLGRVNLDDPAVTLQLIKQNAVLGVVGTFNNNTLEKVGFTCALCHSTADNSVAPGIGKRIDGLANRDLNVGAIIATAPNLQPVVDLLRLAPQDVGITAQDVRSVLNTWGPGKFDAALHFYQLALPAVQPRPGIDFDSAAAARGDELFSGKANCNSCHQEPLWTEPGWNQHTAEEMKIDSFEADRSPGRAYQTMNLAGLFVRERGLFMFPQNKGRFYHDGRFQTLLDVVNSYDSRFRLGLTEDEKKDLVEYLKSL